MLLAPSAQPPRTVLLAEGGQEAAEAAEGEELGLERRPLLFVAPRDDGFSNQRITVAEALRCAAKSGRVAVLPLIFSDVRYGSEPKGPFLFRDYFDLEALARAAVVSFASPDAVATAGVRCNIAASANNPTRALNAFGAVFGWARRDVPSSEPFPKNAPCVTQSLCRIDYKNPSEFGEYSNFDTVGQGYNMLGNENFRRIRSALRPSAEVRALANVVLHAVEGGEFNAVHLRRTDFRQKCQQMVKECKKFGKEAFFQSPETVMERVAALPRPTLPLFVATEDKPWAEKTFGPLLKERGLVMLLATDVALPRELQLYKDRVDMRSFATQIICSHAEGFIGNRFSSFSSEIFNERILNNRTEDKLFF
jgi:GDP-fucose protein O-fucosyltransferase